MAGPPVASSAARPRAATDFLVRVIALAVRLLPFDSLPAAEDEL